jgi:ATP-dependent helicase HrpB
MISLPIDDFLPEILSDFRDSQNLVLSAAPGAGKTTRLPPRLLELTDKKVLVLEPRRIAAVAASARIADEQGWTLGEEVGYQIRFDSKFRAETRLLFLTEALLNRKIISDPELSDVGIVVLDEFHERSQHVDLALGLLKELQELGRPDLKILVMSATLNAEPISRFLGNARIIQVPGQSHPLQLQYQKTAQKLQTGFEFIQSVTAQIRQSAASLQSGEHLLVFLPGVGEIERCFSELEASAREKKIRLLKLHGNLSLEEQKEVLTPSAQSKIILSTNIAESSLTIDGVRAVIDSGLQRRASIHPKTGFPQLEIARISKSSATQRAGRAARQAPGICYRLWSSMDELSMPVDETAEILRVDLSEALLFLASQGVRDFNQFSWFEKPSGDQIKRSEKHLQILGALTVQNELTSMGRNLLKFPLPPRLGKLLLLSNEMGILETGASIAALLLERDIAGKKPSETQFECDICLRLDLLEQGNYRSIDRVKQQLVRLFPSARSRRASPEDVRRLLLQAFSDQLSRRRKTRESRAVMIGGRGIVLESTSQVRESEFFVALQVIEGLSASETKVSLASGIPREWLKDLPASVVETKSWLEFDEKSGKFLQMSAQSLSLALIGSLPLADVRSQPARPEQIKEALGEIAFEQRDQIFQKNEKLAQWWQRFQVWQKLSGLPGFSDETLQEIFSEMSFGENSLTALFEKDLIYFFESKLTAAIVQKFHSDCPEFLQVPSGSRIRVDYTASNPTLEVRLQEVFGWAETPKIAAGKLPLTLVLLGPNYRPVQVTQDLSSFWKNGYPEVRKEMRSRYPKHSWPDDPLTAPAVAKGRPRN